MMFANASNEGVLRFWEILFCDFSFSQPRTCLFNLLVINVNVVAAPGRVLFPLAVFIRMVIHFDFTFAATGRLLMAHLLVHRPHAKHPENASEQESTHPR
jgi:hypothetical protein